MGNFHFHQTQDQSPTLSMGAMDSEKMHNTQGAFTETLHIYGKVLDLAMRGDGDLSLASIGLGLGYVEFMVFAKLSSVGVSSFVMESYEADADLRSHLERFILGSGEIPSDFNDAYSEILALTSKRFEVPVYQILELAQKSLQNGSWILRGELSRSFEVRHRYNGIFYDLFSAKTNPEVWKEDFLTDFFQRAAAPTCVFGTYAARGALNSALVKSGFSLAPIMGLGNKRFHTIAQRGLD